MFHFQLFAYQHFLKSVFLVSYNVGPFSEKLLSSWDKLLKISNMEPSEMIRNCLDGLQSCLNEEGSKVAPEEISIAYVGKNHPFKLLDEKFIAGALEGDYSMIRSHFKPYISSSMI